ncbi:predicted protein [Uncinocarpus reesii 1704]|uniref:Spc7 kinetochore protein domain-containing protein n=1 Tax=Uncinocarpus reesii (strain UAMH 1704) TaxID=336963 RepID=C4JFA5_UNCRE|nr:uncharacterized protein UREG_02327 [Uncinocarpus reesii 1704]EEP77478.1 predicted protein [Uncinocarpus reesii 1704]
MPFPLKSILKPAIPVSPLQSIPTFEETRRKTPARSPQRPSNYTGKNLLIDFSTPPSAPVVGTENLPNPYDTFNPTPARNGGQSRSEQERQIAERERDAREKHERAKQLALEQRAARRKSMDPPYTPDEENNDLEQFSPADQRHLHQRSRRRSSGISPDELDNIDDAFSSSPFSGDLDGDDTGIASLAPDNDDDISDSDVDNESTAMSLDNATGRSVVSTRSDGSNTDSSTRLDQSLRLAARIAGTNGIDYDENEDLSVAYANHEIAGAFKPWIKRGADRSELDAEDLSSRLDQENMNPFRQSTGYPQSQPGEDDVEDGMDLTKPVGGILLQKENKDSEYGSKIGRRLSTAISHTDEQTMEFTNVIGGIHKDLSPSKGFSGDSDIAEDEEMTMEFTSVVGGVLKKNIPQQGISITNGEQTYGTHEPESDPLYPDLTEVDMDMTGAVGGILPPIEEQTEPLEDETFGMEMTNAIGKILPSLRPTASARRNDDLEPEPVSSPFQENIMPSPPKPTTPLRVTSVPFYDGSPSLSNMRLNPGKSRSSGAHFSTTPTKSVSGQITPVKRAPSVRKSPHSLKSVTPTTPTTTPPSRKAHLSPKKISKPESHQPTLTPGSIFHHNKEKGQSTPTIVFQARRRSPSGLGIDKEGLGSPIVAAILDRRRSIGEDAQEFTPKAQITRGVRFNEPSELKRGGSKEELQKCDQHGTLGTGSPSTGCDAGQNIRDLISSLTPKKNKLKSRKSLHVGSAKGVLGKRPVELDMEEDEEDTPKRLRARESSPVKKIKLPAPPSKAETVGRISRFSPNKTRESPFRTVVATREPSQFKGTELEASANAQRHGITPEAEIVADGDSNPAVVEAKPLQLSEFLEMTNIHFMELTTTKRRHTLAPDTDKKHIVDDNDEGSKDINLEDCVAAGFCTIPMLELYQHSCRELKSYISEGRRIIRSIEAETYAENPPLFQEYVTAPPDIRLLMDNQFRNVKAHARLLSKSMWYEWRMKLLEGLKQGLNRHVEEMNQDAEVLSKKEILLDNIVPELIEKQARLQIDAHNLQKAVEEMENCDQEQLKQAREKLKTMELEITQRKRDLHEAQSNLEKSSDIIEKGTKQRMQLLKEIQEADHILEERRGWSVKEVYNLKAAAQDLERSSGWTIISVNPTPDSKDGATLSMRYGDELKLDFHPEAFHFQSTSNSAKGRQSKNMPVMLCYSPQSSRAATAGDVGLTAEMALMLHALRMRISHLTQSSMSPKAFLSGISRTWSTASSMRNEICMLGYCGVTKSKTVEANPGEPALLKVRCILLGYRTETKRHKKSPLAPIVPVGGKCKARIDVDFTIKPRPVLAKSEIEGHEVEVDVDVDVSAGKIYGFSKSDDELDMSEERIGEFLTQLVQRQDGKGKAFGKGLWRDAVKELERKVFC